MECLGEFLLPKIFVGGISEMRWLGVGVVDLYLYFLNIIYFIIKIMCW